MSGETEWADLQPRHWTMWRQRHRGEWEKLGREDRSAYNGELRRRLRETPTAERAALLADLDRQWDSLTPEARERYQTRIATKRARSSGSEEP